MPVNYWYGKKVKASIGFIPRCPPFVQDGVMAWWLAVVLMMDSLIYQPAQGRPSIKEHSPDRHIRLTVTCCLRRTRELAFCRKRSCSALSVHRCSQAPGNKTMSIIWVQFVPPLKEQYLLSSIIKNAVFFFFSNMVLRITVSKIYRGGIVAVVLKPNFTGS